MGIWMIIANKRKPPVEFISYCLDSCNGFYLYNSVTKFIILSDSTKHIKINKTTGPSGFHFIRNFLIS